MTHHHAPPRTVAHGQSRDPNARTYPAQAVASPPKTKRIISNKAVFDSIAHKPREFLGDYVYELALKPARVQDPRTGRPPRHPFASTPKPLPMDSIRGKEGSTLLVKVGRQHLVPAAREEITARRALWGTDIYTDDSDVIAACIHGGWIRGEWPEDVDVKLLGLGEGHANEVTDARSEQKVRGNKAESEPNSDFLQAPLKSGPVLVPEGRDMHVMVLILPNLEKYASTTRFGIKSREWGGKLGRQGQRSSHDGLSFMIKSLRFVTNGALPQSRLRGQARRERMRAYNTRRDAMSVGTRAPASDDDDKERRAVDSAGNANVEEGRTQGSSANEGAQGDQSNRDDDSGVGDVDGARGSAANAPNPAPLPTVASRLTPPSDASDA